MGPTGGSADSDADAATGLGFDASVADAGTVSPPDSGAVGTGAEPSVGCGAQPPTSDTSITVGGSSASYVVDRAVGYDPNTPYPLIFSFRGAGTTAEAFRHDLDLPTLVGADGIVVNVDCADGASTWDLRKDATVFEALLTKLEASYCIDQRRVFVVGHETGAIFANALACEYSDVLRGLGSLNGVEPMRACTGGLAVWISQGNADLTRALGRATRDFWLEQNQCNETLSTPVDPPCFEYTVCDSQYPVRYCEYDGGVDVPSFAAAALWTFLKGL
jgi:pimeloyl-ACP methyl ester carboxylesterase